MDDDCRSSNGAEYGSRAYQSVAEVLSGGTVGVGSLNNTHRDVVDTSSLDEVNDKHGGKACNLVTVQQFERVVYKANV